MKKKILKMLILVMTVLCFPSMVSSASKKDRKQDAIKAYIDFLSQPTIKFHDLEERIKTSDCRFALVYVDNDNIPELVIDASDAEHIMHASGYYNLFTWKKGKIKYVDNTSDGFQYVKKSGVYVGSYYGSGTFTDWYCTLKGDKSDEIARKVEDYGMHDPSDKSYVPERYFFKGKKEIEKEEFESIIKKYIGNKTIITPKFLKNTKKIEPERRER